MDAHPKGALADTLATCGVDLRSVKMEWDELWRVDVLTFSATHVSEAVLTRLADVSLTFPSQFVFATDALQEAFERAVMASPVMMKLRRDYDREQKRRLEALGLSGFAAFDPGRESLSAFAARVEAACGLGQGDLLPVRGEDGIVVIRARPGELKLDDIGTMLALLQSAPGLTISLTGTDEGRD